MLKINTAKWQETPESLRKLALLEGHPRTRERLMALYEITQGKCASLVARETRRNPQTLMTWVHQYNNFGPKALKFKHTGGHPPLCRKK